MNIFLLMVVFAAGEPAQSVGKFLTAGACYEASKAYTNAHCKPVNGDGPIYGTCWACMHGCTAEENIQLCRTDPRPTR